MVCNTFYDPSKLYGLMFLRFGLLLLLVEWLQRDKQHALQLPVVKPFNYKVVRWGIYYLVLALIYNYTGTSQSFIYFQF